jgi:hypothetical protein
MLDGNEEEIRWEEIAVSFLDQLPGFAPENYFDPSMPVADRVAEAMQDPAVAAAMDAHAIVIKKRDASAQKKTQAASNLAASGKDRHVAIPLPLDPFLGQSPVELDTQAIYGPLFCRFVELKKAHLCTPAGKDTTIPFVRKVKGQGKVTVDIGKLEFGARGLSSLILGINKDEARLNSNLELFMLETAGKVKKVNSKQLRAEPLLLVNKVNGQIQVPPARDTVPECAACHAMLLRFHLDWEHERDDFKGEACPYCGAPLSVTWREGEVIRGTLDNTIDSLILKGDKNEIAVIYHGQPVKLVVTPRTLGNLVLRYSELFPNGVLGPFNAKLKFFGNELWVEDFIFQQVPLEDRPATLFPEDMLSF